MPGSGRPSSRSRISGIGASTAATFLAAAGSLSGSSADSWTWIGLPVGGPARGAVTSTKVPAMSARLVADLVHDDVRRRALLPVGEFELDDADGVFGDFTGAARLLADAGIDGLETVGREHDLFDLAQGLVLLLEREIAARVHDDLAVVGLDAREELDAVAEFAVGADHADQQRQGEPQDQAGPVQRELDRAHIEAALGRALVMRHRRGAAEQRTQRRREEQRDRERGRQRRDQRDRHVFHELADHARPEQQAARRRRCGSRSPR